VRHRCLSTPRQVSRAAVRHHHLGVGATTFPLATIGPSSPLTSPPSSAQVAEDAAWPPTEPERAVYHEPLSPSAPFAGIATVSPPHAMLTVDHAALSLEPHAAPPWPMLLPPPRRRRAKSMHARELLCEAAVVPAVALPCSSTV
jgi:hypothetical protein